MTEEESWQPIADTLGFVNEEEMLRHLYTEQNFSIRDIASVVGYSSFVVRNRLMRLQPPLAFKTRGGNNRQGKRSMLACTDEELAHGSVASLSEKYKVHPSTVSAERRLRERLKDEVRA